MDRDHEQLQKHSRIIERLETQNQSIKREMEKMDKKLDMLIDGFNELKLESTKDDSKLELRLKTIETRLEEQEKATRDTRENFAKQINKLAVIISFIAIIIQLIPLLIRVINL